ncbi:MAG: hypothetical protein ABF297_04780 [Thiogranum sp.]
MKILNRLIGALALIAFQPATAIILDCTHNLDGTYSCVEIGKSSATEATSPAHNEAAETDHAYIEQAEKECTYRKPRLRTGGKGPSSALRLEATKSAQKEYDRCVAIKAAELRKAQQSE